MILSFKASNHEEFIQQLLQITGGDRSFADAIANALVQDRTGLARTDAFRSLIFVLVGAGVVWALIKGRLNAGLATGILAVVILVDMWSVDRRYLNNKNFVDKSQLNRQFQARDVDNLIRRDQALDYRVLDLSIPTFSSASASYYHKTIGGYHAAKLKRFQEVIDKQFNNAINEDVLDMLNTKYVITADQSGNQRVENRSTAAGNAWFVNTITYVKNADQEMTAINSFDPKKEAFVGEEFKSRIDEKKVGFDPNAFIKLVSYRPDHLTYEYSAGRDVFAVFSEIWYDKGWNAYVDGERIPHVRANYLLRAASLPGGNHKVEFKFEPASYYTGEIISLIASIVLVLAIAFAIYVEVRRQRNQETAVTS